MAIYVPIGMYCLRLFIVVLQELQTCNFPIPWSLWISICTQSFISQLPLVIEIRWTKLKKDNNNNNESTKVHNPRRNQSTGITRIRYTVRYIRGSGRISHARALLTTNRYGTVYM